MKTEEQEIREAQARLDQARARQVRSDPPTLTLASALEAVIPAAGRYRCNGRCGVILERPGLCDECARRNAAQAMSERLASWLRTIPVRQRDVSWAALPRLTADTGGPRVRLSAGSTLARVRAELEAGPRAVIVGPAGSGKSTLAVAWLRAALEQDLGARVRFVASSDLLRPEVGEEGGPHPLALALSAEVLVLDDLGAELEGAPAGGGIAAQRVGPASRVVAERYERGRSTVVTTGFGADQIAALYGDRVGRRLYEGARVLRLGGGAR